MNDKKIIIGEISEYPKGLDTPIKSFKTAYSFSKQDNWTIYSNDPQFIEAIEVLTGKDNVNVYLTLNGKTKQINFQTAYEYLGDIYDIINEIRLYTEILEKKSKITREYLKEKINEYNLKYEKVIEYDRRY